MPATMLATDLQAQVDAVPYWFHSIDLGGGVVTPGYKTRLLLDRELESLRLPDLRGKTVLDIGAWDGFYSLAAERLGARRVVALDHFVWSIDFSQPAFRSPDGKRVPFERDPQIWRPDDLPGKRGFDLARSALVSDVESIVADFMDTDLEALGQFDVVFYLGVLYHMRHPLLALERLARVTRELAVIETEAVATRRTDLGAWCEYFEADELSGDPTNWWAPNAKALVGMCRAAGFRKVEVHRQPVSFIDGVAKYMRIARREISSFLRGTYRCRLVAHAYK